MRFYILTALALTLAAGCNNAGREAARRELDDLQGTWIALYYEDSNGSVPRRELDMELIISGNRFVVRKGDQIMTQGTLDLDPMRSPKAIDFVEERQTSTGIYDLYSDSLRLCYDGKGEERPNRFTVKRGSAIRFIVLQRRKADPG